MSNPKNKTWIGQDELESGKLYLKTNFGNSQYEIIKTLEGDGLCLFYVFPFINDGRIYSFTTNSVVKFLDITEEFNIIKSTFINNFENFNEH